MWSNYEDDVEKHFEMQNEIQTGFKPKKKTKVKIPNEDQLDDEIKKMVL